jgi:hypothetical protein
MRSIFHLALAAFAIGLMTLAPSVAQASTPEAHSHAHMSHNRAPRVHFHSSPSRH